MDPMNRATVALAATAAIALSSCGPKAQTTNNTTIDSSVSSDTTTANGSDAVGAANTAAPMASPAQTFVNTAAASDAFEIASSKLALDNASSASVKKFANQMITAHQGSTAKLKKVTGALSPALTPDPTLTADQQAKIDDLKAKKGADFDTAYATAQQGAHQATLDALKTYAAGGDVPALKDFASGMVPTVTAHLNMANALK
jgi:putative membrane protein